MGRRHKGAAPTTRRVNVGLTATEYADVEAAASRSGRSMSEVLRGCTLGLPLTTSFGEADCERIMLRNKPVGWITSAPDGLRPCSGWNGPFGPLFDHTQRAEALEWVAREILLGRWVVS